MVREVLGIAVMSFYFNSYVESIPLNKITAWWWYQF